MAAQIEYHTHRYNLRYSVMTSVDILLSRLGNVATSIPAASVILSICNDFVNIVVVPLKLVDNPLFALATQLQAVQGEGTHSWIEVVLQLVSLMLGTGSAEFIDMT